MQHFDIPLEFPDGTRTSAKHPIYVGEAVPGVHPLEQQAAWYRNERGLAIPKEIMDSFQKLADIALNEGVSFEELVVHAMSEEAQNEHGEQEEGGGEQPDDD